MICKRRAENAARIIDTYSLSEIEMKCDCDLYEYCFLFFILNIFKELPKRQIC
jgi:hypothetical protein